MAHVRRNTRLGTVLAMTFLAVLFSGGSPALDRPTIDTRKSETCSFIDREVINNLPTSGRTFAPIAQTVPGQVTVENRFNSRGTLNGFTLRTDFLIDGARPDTAPTQPLAWDFPRVQVNCRSGLYKGEIKGVDLGAGYSGTLQYTRHTQPEDRAYLRAYNLRLNGGPIRGEHLWFFKPMGSQVADQRPPENVPVVPGPPDTPSVPAPGDQTPGFTGWQPRVGLTFRDHGRISGSFKSRQHSQEDCAKHTIDGVSLCVVLGSGNTTVEVFNATPAGFGYRGGVGASIPDLSFGDGYCNMDRCETQGTFYGQPVRKTLDGWRASGADLLADTTVFFNQSQFRLDYRGTYSFGSGSTQAPVVPVVPVMPPTGPAGLLLYTGGPTLPEGTSVNVQMFGLPHNNHEAHAVDYQGQRMYLCLKGEGATEATIRNLRAPNMFDLVRTAPPRPGFQWSTFNCQRGQVGGPIVCNGRGTFYGQDVLARGTTLIQPGSTGAEGTLDVEVVQTKSIVPFGLKYSF